MIYILSSFDRNYVKYYKRFINCLASNFENNLGIDLGYRSVTLIGVPKGEFTSDEILDYINVIKDYNVQNEIKRLKTKISEVAESRVFHHFIFFLNHSRATGRNMS